MWHHSMLLYLQVPINLRLEQSVHEQQIHRHDVKEYSKIKNVKLTADQFKSISIGYKIAPKEGRIQILNDNLVCHKPILVNHLYFALIIIPKSLRRSVFGNFHAGPIGGHMGEYKNLYGMRIQLFWTKLTEDVK